MTQSQFAAYIAPVHAALQKLGGSARPPEVVDEVAAALSVSDTMREERLGNGRTLRFDNQVHWARLYLAETGYIDRSRRGVWTLTDKGRQTQHLSARDVQAIVADVRGRTTSTAGGNAAAPSDDIEERSEAPPETFVSNYRQQLLELLRELPPSGFERLCQRLLRESGFEQVTVTGRSHDGGIDGHGLLLVNRFVSFRVLFQCKRYVDSVGSGEIRNFRGAMQGRADKGIVLTTGAFTAEARREAHRDGVPPIELVDGERLLDLFEELELGLRPRTTYDLEPSFFDDFRESTS